MCSLTVRHVSVTLELKEIKTLSRIKYNFRALAAQGRSAAVAGRRSVLLTALLLQGSGAALLDSVVPMGSPQLGVFYGSVA